MRITESRLRRMIRQVIKENINESESLDGPYMGPDPMQSVGGRDSGMTSGYDEGKIDQLKMIFGESVNQVDPEIVELFRTFYKSLVLHLEGIDEREFLEKFMNVLYIFQGR